MHVMELLSGLYIRGELLSGAVHSYIHSLLNVGSCHSFIVTVAVLE